MVDLQEPTRRRLLGALAGAGATAGGLGFAPDAVAGEQDSSSDTQWDGNACRPTVVPRDPVWVVTNDTLIGTDPELPADVGEERDYVSFQHLVRPLRVWHRQVTTYHGSLPRSSTRPYKWVHRFRVLAIGVASYRGSAESQRSGTDRGPHGVPAFDGYNQVLPALDDEEFGWISRPGVTGETHTWDHEPFLAEGVDPASWSGYVRDSYLTPELLSLPWAATRRDPPTGDAFRDRYRAVRDRLDAASEYQQVIDRQSQSGTPDLERMGYSAATWAAAAPVADDEAAADLGLALARTLTEDVPPTGAEAGQVRIAPVVGHYRDVAIESPATSEDGPQETTVEISSQFGITGQRSVDSTRARIRIGPPANEYAGPMTTTHSYSRRNLGDPVADEDIRLGHTERSAVIEGPDCVRADEPLRLQATLEGDLRGELQAAGWFLYFFDEDEFSGELEQCAFAEESTDGPEIELQPTYLQNFRADTLQAVFVALDSRGLGIPAETEVELVGDGCEP